ncbi:HK97 family phage prohead protease [Hoeflea sp.]|uniref:HK97 family phage prohead protease n=1 Tax=Hoeflea sp. TaxID=1940281 RepID=UPI001998E336|nr:HK97 family phage prohead protease [Hoeflea sp.]MBC7282563.1 HK97 family phage prohead protease [Hoeflea sp.]
MKMHRIQIPLEIKASDDGKNVIGYGSVFGNIDSYGDKIAPGAFVKSLSAHAEKGTAPAMLWQHNPDWPIGKWAKMQEDERGLRVEGVLADTTQARDVGTLVKMGAISGASIGFITKDSDFDAKSGVRTLKEIDLWEVSLVTFPANEAARVESRAADIAEMDLAEIERMLRDADMSRRESKTVISRLLFLGSQRDAAERKEAAELLAELKRLRARFGR